MNIVLLHYASAPIVGGVESVMRAHARLMADDGHHVRIVAGRGQQVDQRIPFVSLPLVDSRHPEVLAIKQDLDAGRLPPAFDGMSARIEEQLRTLLVDTDWLIAHNVCSLNKNLPLTAALHRIAEGEDRPRLIIWHHDLAWITPRYQSELYDGYPWDLLRADWPRAIPVVVSVQRRIELARLQHVAAERVRVIPNGLDVQQFLGFGVQTWTLIHELHLVEAGPLLLLPVRITPRKNVEIALRILASLRERFPNARLLVTGPLGPHNPANVAYYEDLLRLRHELDLETVAHFLGERPGGPLPDDAVAELFRLADVLLLPSREEGFGIPILEAGLAGIAVFCSNIDALRELGQADVNYFPPGGEPAEVAADIAEALDRSACYSLRQRVLREYTWDRIYSKHISPLLEGR